MNNITLIGAVKGEVQTQTTGGGVNVSKASIRVPRDGKPENADKGDFFTVKFWRDLSDRATSTLREGVRIAVTGKHTNDRYEKDGVWRDAWTVHVTDFHIVGGPAQAAPARPAQQSDDEIPF